MTFDTQTTSTNGSESSNASSDGTTVTTMGAVSVYKRLGDLFISAGNVRTTEAQNIPELAAMIDAQGLLSPLHISVELDPQGQPTGRSGVEAGGRRYRALMHLVQQGKATLNDLIECKEVAQGMAKEVSLAENLGQQPMHPADEFSAFQALVAEGKTVQAIANAFGVEVLHVKRRLKLANVAPVLMDLYRKGDLTLDQMMAFATVDDQERQVDTWNGLATYNRHASTIKRKLAEDEIAQDDPRVKVIGLKKYLAAGGTLKEDLFSQGGKPALVDLGLVELMVGEALQAVVDSVQSEGWAWVVSFGEYEHDTQRLHTSLPKQYRKPTPQEAQQRKALEAKLLSLQDELDALHDDDESDWDDCNKKEKEIEALEAQQAALEETLIDFDAFDKTTAGAVVAITDNGILVRRGVVERVQTDVSGGSVGMGARPKPEKPEFPEKLMNNLSSHRTAAMQAAMLTNQRVSLAALANTLALSSFDYSHLDSPLKVSLRQCRGDLERSSDTLAASLAGVALDAAKEKWAAALPSEKAQWFAWFLEQPQETVLDFIVYASAISTNAITGSLRPDAQSATLANALDLDMTQWWAASPATYFDLVPKSKLAAIVRETSTEAAALELEKMKKDAAVAHCVTHTEGKNWLPIPLRPVSVGSVAGVGDGGGDADDEVGQDD